MSTMRLNAHYELSHMSTDWQRNKIAGESLLDFVGKTPLVKLREIPTTE